MEYRITLRASDKPKPIKDGPVKTTVRIDTGKEPTMRVFLRHGKNGRSR